MGEGERADAGWGRNGFEVEPDSVRAGEWINASAYSYGAPPDERSSAATRSARAACSEAWRALSPV